MTTTRLVKARICTIINADVERQGLLLPGAAAGRLAVDADDLDELSPTTFTTPAVLLDSSLGALERAGFTVLRQDAAVVFGDFSRTLTIDSHGVSC
jgi:hypothetical protein